MMQIPDAAVRSKVSEIGNQIHNLGCEHQNNEALSDRLKELRDQLWDISKNCIKPVDVAAVREDVLSIDLMQRVWANLYFKEEDAGNTFQQTINEVVDWLSSRNAVPESCEHFTSSRALSAEPASRAALARGGGE